jgi:hypothetical protein
MCSDNPRKVPSHRGEVSFFNQVRLRQKLASCGIAAVELGEFFWGAKNHELRT